jgi:hypothetical protein
MNKCAGSQVLPVEKAQQASRDPFGSERIIAGLGFRRNKSTKEHQKSVV